MATNYVYLRYSTDKQEAAQQENTVKKYCESHFIKVDKTVTDKAISGKTSWEDRKLAELVAVLKPGDTIIVSEMSRLSRNVSDFVMFVHGAMKKKKARIILCNYNLNIDCSNIDPMTQIVLSVLSACADMERRSTSERTKSALDVRKQKIQREGGFTAKRSGEWCTKLGNPNGFPPSAGQKGADSAKRSLMKGMQAIVELIRVKKAEGLRQDEICEYLNKSGFKTGNGGVFYPYHIRKMLKYDEEGVYYA